ncbi:MAG TPA: hypothetical protein PK441_13485, partial [Burkholderiaceae bacterium]|nr:hypothetical protein [Burkholderiaceae bacterium]
WTQQPNFVRVQRMGSLSDIPCAESSTSKGQLTPFAQVMVTLSKEEEIKLRWEANYWKSQHQHALARYAQREADHRLAMAQAAEREAALRSELEEAQGKIRDLQRRLFGRKSERSSRAEKGGASDTKSARPRGQQPGAPGHGRTIESHLPSEVETIELDCPTVQTVVWATLTFPARRTVNSSRSMSNRTGG